MSNEKECKINWQHGNVAVVHQYKIEKHIPGPIIQNVALIAAKPLENYKAFTG